MAISVSEANKVLIRNSNSALKDVDIEGEVTSIKVASSGHAYITIRDLDNNSKKEGYLVITIWNSNYKRDLREGDNISISGLSFNCWEGKYSINVNNYIKLKAKGPTEKELLEQEYRELDKLGVFNQKASNINLNGINSVGIITSETGAVIQDILTTIKRRGHAFDVYIYPAVMQGSTCVSSISTALKEAEYNNHDVIIIARGGGSKEDLSPFNDKNLALEVASCSTNIISAIGHETDYSFMDYAANIRAATPTAAAELITTQGFSYYSQAIEGLENKVLDNIKKVIHTLEYYSRQIDYTVNNKLKELDKLDLKLDVVDITKILNLGYCVLVDEKGEIISNEISLQELDKFTIIRKNEQATVGI